MTTIAYRDGILASDSRSIRGDTIDPEDKNKIYRARDGRLIAITGDYAEGTTLAKWLMKPSGDRPHINENTRVMEFRRGHVTIYEGKGQFDYRIKQFNAWGSGCQAALGAMERGASARDAIKVASKYDPGTGGKVRSFKERPR